MKGIVLAGGLGTRLYPSTIAVSKQLLPIYDKPMIYYPISVLMLAGIKDILIISTENDLPNFQKLLGNGERFGIKLSYAVQNKPNGLAEAFIIGEDFIKNSSVALILGDNIFYGNRFSETLQKAKENILTNGGATIFSIQTKNPERFGVIEFDQNGKIKNIEEKPLVPKSNDVVTGLYLYDNDVIRRAKEQVPSKRNELEITDLNNSYIKDGKLSVENLGRGFAWLDTGESASLIKAGSYVQTIEENQGVKIACLEEIAYRLGFLDKKTIRASAEKFKGNDYYDYVLRIIE